MSSPTKQRGFTLVEVMIYVIGLNLLIGAIVGFLSYMYGWYRTSTVSPRVDQVAISLTSQLETDLRAGTLIDQANSNFVNNLGSTTITSIVGALSTTTAYAIKNGRVTIQINHGSLTYLTPADINVSKLRFYYLTTPESTAMRFEIGLDYPTKTGTTTNIYAGLAVLRRSYQ